MNMLPVLQSFAARLEKGLAPVAGFPPDIEQLMGDRIRYRLHDLADEMEGSNVEVEVDERGVKWFNPLDARNTMSTEGSRLISEAVSVLQGK